MHLKPDHRVKAEFSSEDGSENVAICQRPDGLFEYIGERQELEDGHLYWVPAHLSGIFSSFEEAVAAAKADVPWLKDRG